MEKNIELEMQPLLPGVEDDNDECYNRLVNVMQSQDHVIRAHLERDQRPATLCLHYDPDHVSPSKVKQLAKQAGTQIVYRYHHDVLQIEGMDCSDCALVIEHSVSRMEGVLAANVNYADQKMRVEYDSHKMIRSAIEKRVVALGYSIPVNGPAAWFNENRELLFSLTTGLLLLAGWLGKTLAGFPEYLSIGLFIAAYIPGGWDTAKHAIHALRERSFDTDLLMLFAALGAFVLGDFAEGALLIFLFSLGHALVERALDRARSAVRALADLAPKTALVRRGQKEFEVPVEQLALNDIVVIRPGVRIPIDGVVIGGQSAVNQAPVTGESIPVEKQLDEKVFAGSVNGNGVLDVKVSRLAKDSTLARVMKMVEEAQTRKSPTQQTIERFEHVFVPSVIVACLLVIFVPPLFGLPLQVSFLRAMTLLVAASPCALALGAPAAVLSGVAQAARNGILVKGGVHLENMGRLKAIAFDKTGTLTHGLPEVTDVHQFDLPVASDTDGVDLLALAAAVESRSVHPLAQAVVRAARSKNLILPPIGPVESFTGAGLRSLLAGKTVLVGSLKWLDESGVSISTEVVSQAGRLQAEGKTLIAVAVDGCPLGLIGLADTLRSEASQIILRLKQAGVQETILLTGDNTRVAEAIAAKAGMGRVYADLMPEDKLGAIRELEQKFGVVAMVGDGINDAPALANATIGIAMGGAGTDIALETADVALMGDDLSKLLYAIKLGRATRAIIFQNLVIALGVIVLLIVTSLTGLAGIGTAILLHEGSTLVVVANALRLFNVRD